MCAAGQGFEAPGVGDLTTAVSLNPIAVVKYEKPCNCGRGVEAEALWRDRDLATARMSAFTLADAILTGCGPGGGEGVDVRIAAQSGIKRDVCGGLSARAVTRAPRSDQRDQTRAGTVLDDPRHLDRLVNTGWAAALLFDHVAKQRVAGREGDLTLAHGAPGQGRARRFRRH